MKEIIQECHAIIKDPKDYLKQRQEEMDYKYVGYTCPFAPELLFHAAGYIPVRIFGFEKKLSSPDRYLPSNCCEFAKNIVDFFGSGEADFLDGMMFTHCCDTLQVVADITPRIFGKPVYTFNLPTHIDSETAISYINREINTLLHLLTEKTGELPEEVIRKSYLVYRQNKELLQRLYTLRAEKPGVISGTDSIALVLAGHFMPKELHNYYLEHVLQELEGMPQNGTALNVIVSGFNNGDVEWIRFIESCGCNVIFDDMCETSRGIPHEWSSTKEEFSFPGTISREISALYCPAKTSTKSDLSQLLVRKVKETDAKAVFFILLPFCDPQAIEYASVKRRLNQQGVRTLMLEPVLRGQNTGQLQTRIEAMLESLQASVSY